MVNSSIEPKKHNRKLYYIFSLFLVLIVLLVIAFFAFRDPLLYGNALIVQLETDKSLYIQGEDVHISAYVINGKDESFVQPTTIDYTVLNPIGYVIYSVRLNMNFPFPQPTFSAHSKTLFSSHVWNQTNSNLTLVESGNYTIKVSLEYGTSESYIQITD